MKPLLVVGDLCPDIVVSGVPTDGVRMNFGQSEDLVTATTLTLGGSASLTACAAAAFGRPTALLAVVGDDELGRMCVGWLVERGVDVGSVRVDPDTPTGSSVILVRDDDAGDRQILTHLGTMTSLRSDHVTDDVLGRAAHVHVSSFFLHTAARETLHESMSRARALGLTVSLDTNDDPDRQWTAGARAAIAQADVLFVNDSEAVGLAGLGADAAPSEAVSLLLAAMPAGRDPRFPAVVHKGGAAGADVHTPNLTVHASAPQVEVVDTVGAGDTLAGTALAALLDGADWSAALPLAVAAGSLSTTGAGGANAQPTQAATRRLALSLTTRYHPQEGPH